MLRVGFAKKDITPPLGNLMAGHLGEKWATGVHDRLYAKSMLIESGKLKVCFVSCDIIFITDSLYHAIRQKIQEAAGILQDNIIISTTHTHSGPLVGDLLGVSARGESASIVYNGIIDSVKDAQVRISEAKIGFASDRIEGISFNRRFIMRDGTVETHVMKGDPAIDRAEGPVDPEVGIIYAVGKDDRFLGALVNFACHPTCMERESTLISADYPGYIDEAIRQEKGEHPVILFLNGASGNICQVDVDAVKRKEVGISWAKHMGCTIASKVLEAISKTQPLSDIDIEVRNATIQIPMRQVTTEQLEQAREILADSRSKDVSLPVLSNYGTEGVLDKGVISLKEMLNTKFWKIMESEEQIILDKESRNKPFESLEVRVVILNDCTVVVLPCEIFVEFGLQIKEQLKVKHVFIATLSNGYAGYIPTEMAFERQGGYETRLLRSSKFVPHAGKMLVKTVVALATRSCCPKN